MKLRKTAPPKNTIGAVKSTFFDNSGVWFWLAIGVIILCVSFWWNRRTERALPINRAADYAYAAPRAGTYSSVTLPYSIRVQMPENAKTMEISFRYRVASNFHSLWLTLLGQRENSIAQKLLIDHVLFRNCPMQSIYENGSSLYQKTVQFTALNAFLLDSHNNNAVVADGLLMQRFGSKLGRQFTFMPLEQDISSDMCPDYIWSTFLKPRLLSDGWLEFSRYTNVAGVSKDSNGMTTIRLESDVSNEVIDITEPVIRFK